MWSQAGVARPSEASSRHADGRARNMFESAHAGRRRVDRAPRHSVYVAGRNHKHTLRAARPGRRSRGAAAAAHWYRNHVPDPATRGEITLWPGVPRNISRFVLCITSIYYMDAGAARQARAAPPRTARGCAANKGNFTSTWRALLRPGAGAVLQNAFRFKLCC